MHGWMNEQTNEWLKHTTSCEGTSGSSMQSVMASIAMVWAPAGDMGTCHIANAL